MKNSDRNSNWLLNVGLLASIAACGGTLELGNAQTGNANDAGAKDGSSSGGPISTGDGGAPIVEKAWQWLNPAPSGEILNAAWAAADNDIWLVGDGGTVLRWDGNKTYTVAYQGPANANYKAIWGNGTNDVWIAGQNGAAHFDGTSWTEDPQLASLDVEKLHGSGDTFIAILASGITLVWPGREEPMWLNIAYGKVARSSYVFGKNRAWRVGEGGLIEPWWGTFEGLHITVGIDTTNGNPRDRALSYDDVTGTGPNDIWATYHADYDSNRNNCVGVTHWNGSALKIEYERCDLHDRYGVWVRGDSNGIYLDGADVVTPYLQRSNGVWEARVAPDRAKGKMYNTGNGRILVAGRSDTLWRTSLARYDRRTQQTYSLGSGFDRDLQNITVDDTGTPWAQAYRDDPLASATDIVRWDGAWTPIPLPPSFVPDYRSYMDSMGPRMQAIGTSLWVTGTTRGAPAVYVWDGRAWTDRSAGLPSQGEMRGIGGRSSTEVAVGIRDGSGNSQIYHLDGVWKLMPDSLHCHLFEASRAVGIIGRCGDMLVNWTNTTRRTLAQGGFVQYTWARAWVGSPNDIWVGAGHFDGSAWAQNTSVLVAPIGGEANDLWFSHPGSMGWPGAILHREANNVAAARSFGSALNHTAVGGGTVWAVGVDGRTLRYGPKLPMPTK